MLQEPSSSFWSERDNPRVSGQEAGKPWSFAHTESYSTSRGRNGGGGEVPPLPDKARMFFFFSYRAIPLPCCSSFYQSFLCVAGLTQCLQVFYVVTAASFEVDDVVYFVSLTDTTW